MNIGTVAEKAGLSAKTIRYYESIGLVIPAGRSGNGYRRYGENDLETLRFIRRARDLGFSVDEVRDLLDLWRDRGRTSASVKALARRHLAVLDGKIAELTAMRGALAHLVDCCAGDDRPDCPILEDLAEGPVMPGDASAGLRPCSVDDT